MDRPLLPAASTPPAATPADPARPRALGRRGFVTGAVFAGTAATAAAVGFAAAPRDTTPVSSAPPAGAVVLAGAGVHPDADDDSTTGLQALVDAAPEGAALWLPAGRHLVDGLVLRAGQVLTGPSARGYTGQSTTGARLAARLATQTAPVLTVGELGRVADIAVEGNDRGQPAVRAGGGGVVLDRVTLVGGSVGFDGAYAGGSLLTGCQVHENGTGIADLVDSVVQACVVNANGGDGISLGPGANDNALIGNKVEWNDGCGIVAVQALHNTVVGGVVDRNGGPGARFVECSHTTLTGAVLRRNGRLAESTPEDDCHVHQRDCTALVVTGIATNAGPDDDDVSGYRSPSVAVRDEGGTDVGYTGNDLTGRTSAVAIATVAPGTRGTRLLNLGVAGVQRVAGTRVRVGAQELDLAAGAQGSAVVDLGGVPAGTLGATYRLVLVAQTPGSDARGLAEVLLLVSRDDGDTRVALGPVDDRVGTDFGTGDGAHRVGVTVSADGATLTVTVQNTRTTATRIGMELS